MKTLPVAVQVYSVRDDAERDFKGTMQKIKDMGYDGVELAGLYGMKPAEVKAILEEVGLVPLSAHVPFQELEADGGHLARRLSGGGAVFHDLGNLNFTFLIPSSDYDLSKQMSVILEAVRSLGIDAQKSGRNDVTVDGKKFSGKAFCQKGGNSYHHGTLMLRVDTQKVARYLNVSEKKLRSKGVSSVTSRVCNLCDFIPDLTREQMQQELLKALSHVYGLEPEAMDDQNFDTKRVMSLYSRYSSWDWLYGRKIHFTWLREERFDWGEKYSFSSTSTTASSKMPLFTLILWTNVSSKESHPV